MFYSKYHVQESSFLKHFYAKHLVHAYVYIYLFKKYV